ncbi:uncharacterized protein [Amphiura filiformis]|uniref:uncharacterized protein n=1 Tax=Amphiura filiformis TaxID=82378 RepID=UPI003B21925B
MFGSFCCYRGSMARADDDCPIENITDDALCPIEKLTDDALLIIFSFLTNEEKCKIARVCQRFRRLAQDGSLWRYIDVHHALGQQIKAFLQRYTCQATKYLKLGHVNHTILQVIHHRCPNLLQLSLTMGSGDTDLSMIPTNLVWLYVALVKEESLQLQSYSRKGVQIQRLWEAPLVCLEYLSVKGGIINDMVCERLSGSHALRQLRFDYSAITASVECQKDILRQVEMLEIHDCRFKSSDAFYNMCDIVGHSSNLKGLELCDPSFSEPLPIGSISLDNLFQAMSGHCSLVLLSVNGPGFFTFREASLVQLLQNLHDLEILSFVYCQDVGDQVLSAIQVGAKNLKVLNLFGNRCITEAGFELLRDHPTLLALSVGSCMKLQPLVILQIAATIPNLILLGMSTRGQDIKIELAQFESEHPNVSIEFSYDQWVGQVERITQVVSEYEMKQFIH